MKTTAAGEQLAIDFPSEVLQLQIRYIPRTLIDPDPEQPRQDADEELRASIARNGVLQPITVREVAHGRFMIVDGERRWRGADGILEELPCVVRRDQEHRSLRLRTQLVANSGKPLSPLEEATAYRELLGEHESVAELARALGRPASSVAERLQLLELGPWIDWLKSGRLPLSHAVRVLLPLRGCSDDVHAKAIAAIEKESSFRRNSGADEDGAGALGVEEFRDEVSMAYRPFLYPLTKTKTSYEKQPEFNTKSHDDECSCGGIKFDLGHSGSARRCCGNPEWWEPKHKKALAEQKKQNKAKPKGRGSNAPDRVVWHVPSGTKVMQCGVYDAPKGITFLTNGYDLKWRLAHDLDFDPSAVVIDESKLVLCKAGGQSMVGTSDRAAVDAARQAWTTRWVERRKQLIQQIVARYKEKAGEYRVSGSGVAEILSLLERARDAALSDAARVAGIECPDAVTDTWQGEKARAKWIAGLEAADAAKILTALAFMNATKTRAPSVKVQEEREQELQRIQSRKVPWAKPPKGSKANSPKNKAAAPNDDHEDDVDAFDDDEELE